MDGNCIKFKWKFNKNKKKLTLEVTNKLVHPPTASFSISQFHCCGEGAGSHSSNRLELPTRYKLHTVGNASVRLGLEKFPLNILRANNDDSICRKKFRCSSESELPLYDEFKLVTFPFVFCFASCHEMVPLVHARPCP